VDSPANHGHIEGAGTMVNKNPMLKALAAMHKRQYDSVMFFDDDEKNVNAARQINMLAVHTPHGLTSDVLAQAMLWNCDDEHMRTRERRIQKAGMIARQDQQAPLTAPLLKQHVLTPHGLFEFWSIDLLPQATDFGKPTFWTNLVNPVIGKLHEHEWLCSYCGLNHVGIDAGRCNAKMVDIMKGEAEELQVHACVGCEWCGFKPEDVEDTTHSGRPPHYCPYIFHDKQRSPQSIYAGKRIRERRHEERMNKITNNLILDIAQDLSNDLGPTNPDLDTAITNAFMCVQRAVVDWKQCDICIFCSQTNHTSAMCPNKFSKNLSGRQGWAGFYFGEIACMRCGDETDTAVGGISSCDK